MDEPLLQYDGWMFDDGPHRKIAKWASMRLLTIVIRSDTLIFQEIYKQIAEQNVILRQ